VTTPKYEGIFSYNVSTWSGILFFLSLYKRSETKILVLLQDTFCEFIYSIHQALFHVPVVPSGWVRVISREGGFLFKPDSLSACDSFSNKF
jgi:hypothetical protein